MTWAPRVLVVDDDDFLREVLRRVFEDAGIAVNTFASAHALLASAELQTPAVLLLDVSMPEMSGLQLQAELQARGIGLPVIFLTGESDVPMVVAAMRNGAADFLEKPWDNSDLIERVRQTFDRHMAPPPPPAGDAQWALVAQAAQATQAEYARRRRTLTPRERDVHALMIVGKTSKMIARDLGGSFRTIETHRTRVMAKMAAANLAELVRMAFEGEPAA